MFSERKTVKKSFYTTEEVQFDSMEKLCVASHSHSTNFRRFAVSH